jgi:hypothetical protein
MASSGLGLKSALVLYPVERGYWKEGTRFLPLQSPELSPSLARSVCRVFRLEAHSLCIAHEQLSNKLVHFDTTGMYFNHHEWGVLEVAYSNLRSYTQGLDTRSGQYILFGLHQSPQAIVRCSAGSRTRVCERQLPPAPICSLHCRGDIVLAALVECGRCSVGENQSISKRTVSHSRHVIERQLSSFGCSRALPNKAQGGLSARRGPSVLLTTDGRRRTLRTSKLTTTSGWSSPSVRMTCACWSATCFPPSACKTPGCELIFRIRATPAFGWRGARGGYL